MVDMYACRSPVRLTTYKKKGKVMKKTNICSLLMIFFLVVGSAFWAYANDVKEIPACKYCGMNREMFAHSRMLIEYDDGTVVGTCSLHCAALDLALNLDKNPKTIRVGDFGTKELIDAETAVWVVGGNKPGVMTKNAKWAFAKKEDAEKFRQENGGTITGFDQALEAAYKDINADTKMIRERRKMMKMKMMEKK
jgi:copper chaperone NosL